MGEVKHIVLAKFKDGISQQQIDDLIKGYANLVHQIEPMKSLKWRFKSTQPGGCVGSFWSDNQPSSYENFGDRGKDVSIENMNEGFTHVFESTFETVEGIATYVSHPVHVEFATLFLGHLDKVLVVDFKPTAVDP